VAIARVETRRHRAGSTPSRGRRVDASRTLNALDVDAWDDDDAILKSAQSISRTCVFEWRARH
jgi:hypothetical protein